MEVGNSIDFMPPTIHTTLATTTAIALLRSIVALELSDVSYKRSTGNSNKAKSIFRGIKKNPTPSNYLLALLALNACCFMINARHGIYDDTSFISNSGNLICLSLGQGGPGRFSAWKLHSPVYYMSRRSGPLCWSW